MVAFGKLAVASAVESARVEREDVQSQRGFIWLGTSSMAPDSSVGLLFLNSYSYSNFLLFYFGVSIYITLVHTRNFVTIIKTS